MARIRNRARNRATVGAFISAFFKWRRMRGILCIAFCLLTDKVDVNLHQRPDFSEKSSFHYSGRERVHWESTTGKYIWTWVLSKINGGKIRLTEMTFNIESLRLKITIRVSTELAILYCWRYSAYATSKYIETLIVSPFKTGGCLSYKDWERLPGRRTKSREFQEPSRGQSMRTQPKNKDLGELKWIGLASLIDGQMPLIRTQREMSCSPVTVSAFYFQDEKVNLKKPGKYKANTGDRAGGFFTYFRRQSKHWRLTSSTVTSMLFTPPFAINELHTYHLPHFNAKWSDLATFNSTNVEFEVVHIGCRTSECRFPKLVASHKSHYATIFRSWGLILPCLGPQAAEFKE